MNPSIQLLLHGLGMTCLITFGGAIIAAICAFLAGLGRLSIDPIVRFYAKIYIEVFRGTSALVQLFWFYFALPLLLGIELNAILVGMLVIGLNIGAYGAEVVRAAIEDVPVSQHLAGVALNLTSWQRMRYIILPQAMLKMLPPFGNLLIELLKSTALVSMITVTDLTRAGVFLRDSTHRTAEIFGVLLLIYFMLSLCISFGVKQLEKYFSQGLSQGGTL